jgi:hypothetical protein
MGHIYQSDRPVYSVHSCDNGVVPKYTWPYSCSFGFQSPRSWLNVGCRLHSNIHKQANCPLRSAKDRAGDARVAARNFACAVETPVRGASASLPLSQLSTPNDVEGKRDRQPQSSDPIVCCQNNVYRADGKTRSTCNAGDRRVPGHDNGVQC